MTVLQTATAKDVHTSYGMIDVGAPGPPGDPGIPQPEALAYVSESLPSVVVLNVVSDLIPCDVTAEEVDTEPDGEALATIPITERGPIIVNSPTRGEVWRLPIVLAPGRYRVWVQVENRGRARQLEQEWDYDTAPDVMPTTEHWRVTYLRDER